MPFAIKRIYDDTHPDDGQRVLVDRLWPRGVAKTAAHLALWLKEIAPTPDLRKWFGHDPKRWSGFCERYIAELRDNPEPVQQLLDLARHDTVTLLYAAKDPQHNHALALKHYLDSLPTQR